MFWYSFFLLWRNKIKLNTFRQMPRKGTAAGVLLFLHFILHVWAISLTKAAFMISLKRLSVLFRVIRGELFLKKKTLKPV